MRSARIGSDWRSRRRRLGQAGAIALVALGFAAGGVGWAASGSSGVIDACASTASGALSLAPASGCPTDSTAVQWNVQGPAGLQGPTGPRGLAGTPGIDNLVVHVDQPTSTVVISPHVPLQPPPAYRRNFSIQASLSASGRYAALASVELQVKAQPKRVSKFDCQVVVTAGGINTLIFDEPIMTTRRGDVPVDYSGTFVTSRPATLTFQCVPKGAYGAYSWVNPTLYAGLLVTPQLGQ
jgi:hypothetical protein